MNFFLKILFVLLIIEHASGNAQERFQYDASAERKFSRAVQLYQNEKYDEAMMDFDSLLNGRPIHQRTTAAYLMAAKTLYELKRFNASAVLLNEFLKSFSETNYSVDACYTLGVDYMMLQRPRDAANQFLRCIAPATDTGLRTKAVHLLSVILENQLSSESVEKLIARGNNTDANDLLIWKLSEKYYYAGEQRMAEKRIDNILGRDTKSVYDKELRALKGKLRANNPLKIGLILPSWRKVPAGQTKSISEDLIDGIKYALNEFRLQSNSAGAVNLEIRDDGRDPKVAINAINDLSSLKEVIAVIGPLYSNTALASAPYAEKNRIPMVSPTANANGISAVGKHIFQANPDLKIRGMAMARYAVNELGMKNIAVLASTEPVGRAIAESFQQEVAKLGAKIVSAEHYAKGSSDLSDQFLNIRKAGLKLKGKKESAEETKVPVSSIDGLFLPIADAEDIGMLVSQIKYFNIETQLLGTGEWYSPQQLDANKRYLNGLIMLVDSYYDEKLTPYKEFEKQYMTALKKQPTKYSILGYDITRLILEQINSGSTSREKLAESLQSVKSYQGIHGKISFTNTRVNSEFQVIKYANGVIQKIGEINIQ